MTKQEFLAMSLPYGLKVVLNQKGKFNLDEDYPQPHNEVCSVVNVLTGKSFEYEISDGKVSYGFIEDDEFDLILRPLSDLTKLIQHKGQTFVPIEWFEIGDTDNDSIEYDHGNIKLIKTLETISIYNVMHDIAYLPFAVVLKLIEWKFDIADLISKGEAIDVNTLDINPYK